MLTRTLNDLPFLSQSKTLDPVASDWASRVVANGGPLPSSAYQKAVSDLVIGLKTDSVWSKFIYLNGIVPGPVTGVSMPASSWWAPCTPILVGPTNAAWPDRNGNSWASSAPNGTAGVDLNGTIAMNFGLDVSPLSIWSSATNIGVSVYVDNATLTNKDVLGATNNGSNWLELMVTTTGSGLFEPQCGARSNFPTLTGFAGYYSMNRASTARMDLFAANSTNPHSSIFAETATDTTDPRTNRLLMYGDINTSSTSYPISAGGTISGLSMAAGHLAFNASESALVYSRFHTFRQAIGGGFA